MICLSNWLPFAAVLKKDAVLSEINYEKSCVDKPELSEDQIAILEERIFEFYNNASFTEILFYQNNHIYKIVGVITKIEINSKKIIINAKKAIYFTNILRISEKTIDFFK